MQNLYLEPLPEDCPPEESEYINETRIVFRLVRNDPPTDDDFMSQRAQRPNRRFRVSECQARGLSVHSDVNASRAIQKLPRMRMQGMKVCRVVLDSGAGRIQKTGGHYHYTWWPLANFDILGNCSMV